MAVAVLQMKINPKIVFINLRSSHFEKEIVI